MTRAEQNKNKDVLVMIPTYQEAGNIIPLVTGIFKVAELVHILFIDDGSQDGTREQIAKMAEQFAGKVHLLPRPGKLGLGTAYVAGFKWGLSRGYDAFVEMDADLSHRPEDLKTIVQALSSQKVVIGSRYIRGGGTENWSLTRRIISQAGSFYARTILRLPVRDLTGGFNGWHRSVIEAINPDDIRSEGYTFQVELKFRARLAGYYLHEVPILFVERRVGQSKMSGGIIWEAVVRTWLLAAARNSIKRRISARTAS